MTPAQFRTRVSLLCGYPATHPQLTTGLIDDWAHDGLLHMFSVARPWNARKSADQNLVASQEEYYLPADFLLPITVKITDAGTWHNVIKVTMEDLDDIRTDWQNNSPASIIYYYEKGVEDTVAHASWGRRKIGLSPTPGSTVTNGLRVRYIRKPAKFATFNSSVEIVDVSERYHDHLAHYVAYRYLTTQASKPDPKFQQYYEHWTQGVLLLQRESNEEQQTDYSPTVGTPMARLRYLNWGV